MVGYRPQDGDAEVFIELLVAVGDGVVTEVMGELELEIDIEKVELLVVD